VMIHVADKTDAIALHIPWRRRDLEPEKKNVIIVDAQTGQRIDNVFRVDINREYGDLIFQPQTVPGDYYIYYLPYSAAGSANYPKIEYRAPAQTAAEKWLQKHQLTSLESAKDVWKQLTQATVKEFQSIDQFNSFYPMEVIATKKEVVDLLAKHPDKSYLLFPEDRTHPIRMTNDLPCKWIKTGPQDTFKGKVGQGEYYVFQVGVYAAKASIPDLEIEVSIIKNKQNSLGIPPSAITCFNLGGIDWVGNPLNKKCPIEQGKVQPLWFGLEIPEELLPGEYEGTVKITPQSEGVVVFPPQTVKLELIVTDEKFPDYGDSEPWRLSHLRWLNSTLGQGFGLVAPFTEMTVEKSDNGPAIGCLGRTATIGAAGFPVSIKSRFAPGVTHIQDGPGREILAGPITVAVEDANGQLIPLEPAAREAAVIMKQPGAVGWTADSSGASGALLMNCMAIMEMDGFCEFHVTVRAPQPLEVKDIRLEIPIAREVARYMMGLGLKGGYRPPAYEWQWDVQKNQDGAWLGDVNAGLQYSLRGSNYSRPLNTNFYHLKPLNMPVSWYNDGKGGTHITEKKDEAVLVTAYSGARTLKPGEDLHFNFTLLITPFKPLDTAGQWKDRYYHRFDSLDKIAAAGANTVNVHHATEINPFINYPFMRAKEMKAYIDEAHQRNMKVKIYYTVRELSNIAPELFMLRSLGDEVLAYGPGGGFAWLQEHLGDNYIPGWLVPELKDAAVINSGVSRWHNYYVEGLNWLLENVGIDGLYIDDVAFDRTIMKRVRKLLDYKRPGSLIDLHSANQYNPRDGFTNSANLYLEHFPYLNRLWFGEYFDYNSSPDFWLIEMSGIPYGLMGEMLQDGGNPWRGMLYGMTNRMPWSGDPSPLWKAWDEFGIRESQMTGYWSPDCPVKTDNKDVLATTYVIKGKRTMVAIGSWAKKNVKCKLSIDWNALGLDINKARITAPVIKNFQPAAVLAPNKAIPIPKGKGWLLIIDEIK
ncbi:MAG TPA: glycoside hydrolase domain-containing protein, partial [Candidatus Deferrimicrobium sp.]|nr:glycoside hydrolase domain-containing protein [Candidatus Deferrimicrobium sp.]